MFKTISKLLTKNFTKVPLIMITFDLNKFNKDGAKDSCLVEVHPYLAKNAIIKQKLNEVIDMIRNTYDMNKLSK